MAKITGARLIPDPSMTDAEYFEQRRTKSGPNVGKVVAQFNMLELIGGLARIEGRSEVQEAAAAKYRMLHERAQIGGAKAIDYEKAKVDSSGPREDMVEAIGAGARQEYEAATRFLGMLRSSLVERIVVHDMSISSIAGRGGHQMRSAKRELLAALDDLAVHFKMASRRAA